MKDNNKNMSQAQVQRLLHDLPDLSQKPARDHLDDKLIIGYVTETLTDEESERVDTHLINCIECTKTIEHLFETVQAWQGETGTQRLEALSQQILREIKRPTDVNKLTKPAKTPILQQLAQLLQQAEASWQQALLQRPIAPLMASTHLDESDLFWNDTLVYGTLTLYCQAILDSRGNLRLHFSSNKLELEGEQINVRLEFFEGKFQFEAETSTDVGADLIIPKRLVPEDLSQLKIKLESAE